LEDSFRSGVKACIPTILGYVGIGISAGIIGRASGLSPAEVALMSILIYAGAAQFIITSLLLAGTPASAIILTTFIVNSRHLLMSMATAPHVERTTLLHKIGIGSLLTDESFAVAMTRAAGGKKIPARWFHGLNITAYLTWISSTVLGAVLGGQLENPARFGLDFALSAMFIGLLYLQVESERAKRLLLNGVLLLFVGCSFVLLSKLLSPEMTVLSATLLGATAGVVISRWISVKTSSS